MKLKTICVLILLLLSIAFTPFRSQEVISLAGDWNFELDSDNIGEKSEWFNKNLNDKIHLPCTTDEARKGVKNDTISQGMLTRVYYYYGAAWYQREINIPESWAGKHITFSMERTKASSVWINGKKVGSQQTLTTAHVYDLTTMIFPGKNVLTVRVNNHENEMPPVGHAHQIGDQTQTNWNGILGTIELRATDPVWLEDVQVYPDIHNRKFLIKLKIEAMEALPQFAKLDLSGYTWNTETPDTLSPRTFSLAVDNKGYLSLSYDVGKKMQLWDEFTPALYKIKIDALFSIGKRRYRDSKEISCGMREFKTNGSQFTINGKVIFLRGKNDGGLFPLNGYGPMDVDGWLNVFNIAKSYGINHYRFHTWCPPKAAFEAADIAGIYLQPELPVWAPIGHTKAGEKEDVELLLSSKNDPVQQRTLFLQDEGKRMLSYFGNHPSFVMFALGNEMHGSRPVMADLIKEFRKFDHRRLYAEGSNNYFQRPSYAEGDDYWITTMTGGTYSAGNYRPNSIGKDVRSSYPVDTVGHINNVFVGTCYNYSRAIKDIPVPIISHENGQFQTFPDFKDTTKYTGVLEPRYYKTFLDKIKKAGLYSFIDDYARASGKLAVICYREDIETALRTPGFGGFQLLDLQDYHWGPALVGILDAFMDSKGLISPKKWREFCSAIVPLIEMESFIWTNEETFTAKVKIANYGPDTFDGDRITWTISDVEERILYQGDLSPRSIPQGGITQLGSIEVNLKDRQIPQKMNLNIRVNEYNNSYSFWVYPSREKVDTKEDIIITHQFDPLVEKDLEKGKTVLLLTDSVHLRQYVRGAFVPDFWSYSTFRKYNPPATMGLLCDPEHPIFANFPTEFHSNWQWWRIAKRSPVMILDDFPQELSPVVRVIDSHFLNRRLGLLWEAKIGRGRLMISSINLLADLPEVRSLYAGIVSYMGSKDFNPTLELSREQIQGLFKKNN